jgi:ribosomal protein L22
MAEIKTVKPKTEKIKVVKAVKVAKPVEKKVIVKPVEVKPVLAKYINKNLKISPRKLRLLVTDIKKLAPADCVTRLKFSQTNAGRLLAKCVADAIASAHHNYNLLPASLKFTEFRVDEGMKIKRMDKSHGSRFARGIIQKRHSRLVIVLSGTIQS